MRIDDRSGGGSSSLGDRRRTMRRENSTSRAFDASRVLRAVRCVERRPTRREDTRSSVNEFLTTRVYGCYETAKPEVPEAISDSDLQNVRVVNPEARSTHQKMRLIWALSLIFRTFFSRT